MAYQAETPARAGLFFTANITARQLRLMLPLTTPATCWRPNWRPWYVPRAHEPCRYEQHELPRLRSRLRPRPGATGYQIVYGRTGFTPGGASAPRPPSPAPPTRVTGLTAGTATISTSAPFAVLPTKVPLLARSA